MKKTLTYLFSFLAISVWLGCEKHDYAAGVLSPIASIEDVRDLYKTSDITLDKNNLRGADKIVGVVISNPDSLNLPEGIVVMQETRRKRVRGIILAVENASNYKMGDSLIVSITGKKLEKVNGGLQISGLNSADIEVAGTGFIKTPLTVSNLDVIAKPNDYESTLIKIKGGTVSPEPSPTEELVGDKVFVNGADSLVLHTETNAHFASNKTPANASFAGILFIRTQSSGVNQLQLWPRTIDDISDRIAPVDPDGEKLGPMSIIITGFLNDAAGGDANYEYIQFLATRNIDFEKTPVAVVTCNNATNNTPDPGEAPSGGWAAGGQRTYKFNITSGTVKKGKFFYVGGTAKTINGANSLSISQLNWVCSINYSNEAGAGFGTKTSNLLANSGNPAGVAVFEGINVLETSIPIDAVFYGGTTSASSMKYLYNPATNKGYRVALNDHYSPVDPLTGTDQPFPYQGTNTYKLDHFPPELKDHGTYFQFGGKFDGATKKWITPRGYFPFTTDLDPANPTTVSDIEGRNITTIIN